MSDGLFEVVPTDDPLRYPGELPDHSFVLLPGRRLLMLDVESARGAARRLGQGQTVDPENEVGTFSSLNSVLLKENAAPIDARHPVLAIGSNAAPAQLARKFQRQPGLSSVFPVVRAEVRALRVLPSAHLNPNGYLPATAYVGPPAASRVAFVTFLDDRQLRCMDKTEPNYMRVPLDPRRHPVLLDSGEQLAGCDIYESRHGVIVDPRLTDSLGTMPSQRVLVENLLRELPTLRTSELTVEDFIAGVRLRNIDAAEITQAIQDHFLVRSSELHSSAQSTPTYGEAGGQFNDPAPAKFTVIRSSTPVPGEGTVCLNSKKRRELSLGAHAALASPYNQLHVVARVEVDESLPDDAVAVDQTLRNALGVEVHERIDVSPARLPSTPWARFGFALLGQNRYVVAWVQTADLATVEQDGCVVSDLALDLLGISSGDLVVIEGGTRSSGVVLTTTMRAFRAPQDIVQLREQIAGGQLDARFPSAQDALGVYPDLVWAFLDDRTRRALGVTKLSPVRIRAQRAQQVRKERRELLLVIALAMFGVLTSDWPWLIRGVVFGALSVALAFVVITRLRARLRRAPASEFGTPGGRP